MFTCRATLGSVLYLQPVWTTKLMTLIWANRTICYVTNTIFFTTILTALSRYFISCLLPWIAQVWSTVTPEVPYSARFTDTTVFTYLDCRDIITGEELIYGIQVHRTGKSMFHIAITNLITYCKIQKVLLIYDYSVRTVDKKNIYYW